MDITTFFAGFLLFCSVSRCHSHAEMLLNLEVKGNFAVKTGIQKYTIYERPSNTEVDYVIVTCSTPLSLPANISLIKENEIIAKNYTNGKEIRVIKSYPSHKSYVTGIYTCRLSIALHNTNESFMEYRMASKLEINATNKKYICGSSIGGSGYLGERVSLTCEGEYRNSALNWSNTSSPHEITLTSPNLGLECGYTTHNGDWRSTCQPPFIRIHQILSVTLSSLNHTFGSLVTGYICRSSPARMIKWEVIGSCGNILNFENMHLSTKFGTKVNITQSFAETYLWIFESVPGGNGIHKIICSTYDTTANAFSTTQVFPHISYEIQSSDDCASTSSHILTQETPGGGENENFFVTSTEEGNVMVKEGGCVAWKTVTITLLLIFLSLNILTCYLYQKKYQIVVNTSTANNYQHQRRKTQTELFKKPTYLSVRDPSNNATGASFDITGTTSKDTEIVGPEKNRTYSELV